MLPGYEQLDTPKVSLCHKILFRLKKEERLIVVAAAFSGQWVSPQTDARL